MKENKTQKPVDFFCIVWALFAVVFLFNPDYTLFDILPDTIGYLMLVISLSRLCDLNSYFSTASDRFSKLIALSGFKFLSYFTVTVIFGSKEGPTMTLLLLFCFAIGDILLGISAWKAFFEGFAYEGFRYGDSPQKGALTDRLKNATVFFLIFKEVLTILPEFSVLASQEYIDNPLRWDEFTGLFRTCSVMIVGVAGIIWLIRMIRFVTLTMKNTEVLAALRVKYDDSVLVRTGLFRKRRISLLTVVLLIAVAFTCDFVMDGVNLIPDFLFGLFSLVYFLLAKGYTPLRKAGIILSTVHIPVSGAAWWLSFRFVDQNSLSKVMTEPETFRAFWKFYPAVIFETVLLAGIIICLLLSCNKIIGEHCGYVPESDSDQYHIGKLAAIRKNLRMKLIRSGSLFFITAVASNLSYLVAAYSAGNTGDYWWVVCFALSILCIWCFYKLGAAIRHESEARYLLS